jgi:hypothetical protein
MISTMPPSCPMRSILFGWWRAHCWRSAPAARRRRPSRRRSSQAMIEASDADARCLERDHKWLRKALTLPDSERRDFWEKFAALPVASKPAPAAYAQALAASLPASCAAYVPKPRAAGTGSLGRPRFIAYTDWQGGPVLREAKAMLQSAWSLAHAPGIAPSTPRRSPPAACARRSALSAGRRCAGRRLSPSSTKIEIDRNPDLLLSPDMLDLMGFEIGNCHANDPASGVGDHQGSRLAQAGLAHDCGEGGGDDDRRGAESVVTRVVTA